MPQSMLCTGTWLLGFRAGRGGLVSYIYTEGDRGSNIDYRVEIVRGEGQILARA